MKVPQIISRYSGFVRKILLCSAMALIAIQLWLGPRHRIPQPISRPQRLNDPGNVYPSNNQNSIDNVVGTSVEKLENKTQNIEENTKGDWWKVVFSGNLHPLDKTNQENHLGVDENQNVIPEKELADLATPKKKFKQIFFWTHRLGLKDWKIGIGREPLSKANCPVKECEFTYDPDMFNSSDVVLFAAQRLPDTPVPLYRNPDQVWVFYNREPPYNTKINLTEFNGIFNLTWTYRHDSDVSAPYGMKVPLNDEEKKIAEKDFPKTFAANKTMMISWVVSHCDAESGRDWVAQQLAKYVPVFVYGHCPGGSRKCNKKDPDCLLNITHSSKFYLAFENCLCKDYITEKVWRPLQYPAIPIVLGNGNYKELLPEHSYIDLRDFSSIKDLADYIKLLDKNEDLYNQYFEWRKLYKIALEPPLVLSACDLCKHLHHHDGETKIIEDLDGWYGRNNCISKSHFFKFLKDNPW